MRADHAKVTWNAEKKRWEARIQVGAEVVRRPLSKNAGDAAEALKSQAVEIAKDEGYELDPAQVEVVQEKAA